jgi:large subunit ribosomal protein L29
MNYQDIATLSLEELLKRKKDLGATLFEARMKNALGQLTNPMTIRFARRDVARINTVLGARAAAQVVTQPAPQSAAAAAPAAATKARASAPKKVKATAAKKAKA